MNNRPRGLFRVDRAGNISEIATRALLCFRIYYRPFGIYGVLSLLGYRLFGWPEELAVQPAGIKNTLHLRLRTSDVSVCDCVLLRQQYAIDLSFSPKIIVDAGANIGMASIYYAHRYPDAESLHWSRNPRILPCSLGMLSLIRAFFRSRPHFGTATATLMSDQRARWPTRNAFLFTKAKVLAPPFVR